MLKSKINRTQAATAIASLAVVFGLDVDQETALGLVVAIQLAGNAVTWILRTWFNQPKPQ